MLKNCEKVNLRAHYTLGRISYFYIKNSLLIIYTVHQFTQPINCL